MPRCIVPALAGALMLAGAGASAHDPSAYGGLFRSRDLGGTWLNADVGLFLNSALAVAVDPSDPNHLLLGTDLGLMRSRTGGSQLDARSPGSDHRRRVRARLHGGRPKRGLRRPERRVPLSRWPVASGRRSG